MKAGLELTPDQTKNWPQFEQAVRDLVQLRVQRLQARQASNQQAPGTPFERLAQRADAMAKTSTALKHIADAGTPLYMSLTDTQKERFKTLAHALRPHHHHMHGWNREGGRDGEGGQGWGHHRRFGDQDQGGVHRTIDTDDQDSKL